MKHSIIIHVFSSLVLYFWSKNASGQIMEFPDVYYKKIQFDVVHRGSYNITDCAAELINCWEIIRPDIICDYEERYYESVCGALRKHCSGKFGAVDVNYGNIKPFSLSSLVCESHHIYTRRYVSIPRNDSRAMAILRALNYTDELGGDINTRRSV